MLQTPQLDENFAFRLVDNRPCNDQEYTAWKAEYTATLNGDLMLVNTHILNGPTCLLSKNQAIDINNFIGSNGISTFNHFQDEICFSGAAPQPLALLLLAVVTLAALLL